jgi:hypothetical protein
MERGRGVNRAKRSADALIRAIADELCTVNVRAHISTKVQSTAIAPRTVAAHGGCVQLHRRENCANAATIVGDVVVVDSAGLDPDVLRPGSVNAASRQREIIRAESRTDIER